MDPQVNYDPFQIILADAYGDAPSGRPAIADALRLLQETQDLTKLEELLLAADPGIVGIGLQLFAELDTWAYPLMPLALKHISSSDRRDREHIADALLINSELLGIQEAATGLRLMADEDPVVRWKAIELVTLLEPRLLDEASNSLLPLEHQQGVTAYRQLMAGKALDVPLSKLSPIVSGYICSAILTAQKRGLPAEVEGLTLSEQDSQFLGRRIDRLRRFGR